MGNVTKYLQKLGMGIYDKPAGCFQKNNLNLGKPHFSTHRLEVKYAVAKQISM